MFLENIVLQAENQTLKSRLSAFQRLNQNSLGAEMKTFADASAYKVVNIPGPSFNKVRNINTKNYDYLTGISDWYEQTSTTFQIEITPQYASEALFESLQQQGFKSKGMHTSFCGKIEDIFISTHHKTATIDLLDKDEFAAFAAVYVKGFGLPNFIEAGVRQNNAILFDVSGWTFFKATVDHTIVAIAVLYVEKEIATLAAATTLPAYRGQGIHKSLIEGRVKYAKRAGAKYITSEAKPDSISHVNMEKCGIKLVHRKYLYGR